MFTTNGPQGGDVQSVVLEQELSASIGDGFTERISAAAESNSNQRSTNNRVSSAENKVAQGGNSGTVTSYEYLSDPSVKLNGTTYTIEKNAAGLISKITDSLGNTLKPTVSGEITDIVLHNAALWGAVLARGIGKAPEVEMPDMNGITGYFVPENADVKNSIWKNSVLAGDPIVLTNVTKSGNVLEFTPNSYGIYTVDEPNTVYAIVRLKAHTPSGVWNQIISKSTTQIADRYEFNLTAHLNYIDATTAGNDVTLSSQNTVFGVYAYTRAADAIVKGFFDGNYIGSAPRSSLRGRYGGKMGLNKSLRETGTIDPTTSVEFIMCAFGTDYHTDEQIIKNSQWLIQKLNGDWKN